jgi:hypothetical protein
VAPVLGLCHRYRRWRGTVTRSLLIEGFSDATCRRDDTEDLNRDISRIRVTQTVEPRYAEQRVRNNLRVREAPVARPNLEKVMKPRKTVVMLVAGMAMAASIEVASVGVAGAASNTTTPTPPKTKTAPKPNTVKPSATTLKPSSTTGKPLPSTTVKPSPRKAGMHTKRSSRPMPPRQHRMPKHRRMPVHLKRR